MERLAALSQPSPQSLSRQEHDTITESKLVRKRTQAKQRSERESGASRVSLEDGRQVVEVIRKNSVARQHGPAGTGAPVLPPVSEQTPVPSPQVPQGLPPPAPAQAPAPGPAPGSGPGPARQFPNQHRYTLVDPGSGSGGSPPPSRTESPSYARPAGRPPGQRAGSTPMPSPAIPQGAPDAGEGLGRGQGSPPPGAPRVKGPTTFAEMGIQGVKLEEKECVIM